MAWSISGRSMAVSLTSGAHQSRERFHNLTH
jgi:hypothetical protein